MKKAEAQGQLNFIQKYAKQLGNGFAITYGLKPGYHNIVLDFHISRRRWSYEPGVTVIVDGQPWSAMTPEGAMKYIMKGWGGG